MDNLDKIITKLQKILNIGDSNKNNSLEEVNSAMLLANKLLKKHGLSMADIMTKEEISDGSNYSIMEGSASKFKCSKIPGWMTMLVSATNSLTDTRSIYISKKPKGSNYGEIDIIFVGIETDVQIAIELFNFLRTTVNKLSSAHKTEVKGNHTVWRSFATGCSKVILERSQQLESFKDNPDIVPLSDDDLDDLADDQDDEYDGYSEETIQKFELMIVGKHEAIDEYINSSSTTGTESCDIGKTIVRSSYEQGVIKGQSVSLVSKNLIK